MKRNCEQSHLRMSPLSSALQGSLKAHVHPYSRTTMQRPLTESFILVRLLESMISFKGAFSSSSLPRTEAQIGLFRSELQQTTPRNHCNFQILPKSWISRSGVGREIVVNGDFDTVWVRFKAISFQASSARRKNLAWLMRSSCSGRALRHSTSQAPPPVP